MLSEKAIKAVNSVTEAIKESQEYKDFEKDKKLVKDNPQTRDLVEKVKNIQLRLMNIPEDERNSDYAESLLNEYEEITENTAVYDYSRAESLYVTMLQEVLGSIVESVDL
ncbi:MAG: YlbF family regulator [Lachnospiraceae bacterium]|nr:YlbF family regulator [Lachnospiraceae bacterium]